MYVTSDTIWEIFEQMKETLGTETLLDNLAQAMGTDDLKENLEYIDRMFDTGLFDKVNDDGEIDEDEDEDDEQEDD